MVISGVIGCRRAPWVPSGAQGRRHRPDAALAQISNSLIRSADSWLEITVVPGEAVRPTPGPVPPLRSRWGGVRQLWQPRRGRPWPLDRWHWGGAGSLPQGQSPGRRMVPSNQAQDGTVARGPTTPRGLLRTASTVRRETGVAAVVSSPAIRSAARPFTVTAPAQSSGGSLWDVQDHVVQSRSQRVSCSPRALVTMMPRA